jgi:hypothetical protein
MAGKTQFWTEDRVSELAQVLQAGANYEQAREKLSQSWGLNLTIAQITNVMQRHGLRVVPRTIRESKPFTISQKVSSERTAEEIIEAKKLVFDRKAQSHSESSLIQAEVKVEGPYAIAFFGDPHLDDDGCDIGLIEEHIRIVRRTPEILPVCVGDYTNNWIGRLSRLYAQQTTTAKEGWKLTEWFVGSLPWLVLVGGNHDAWSGDGDPVEWFARQSEVRYEMHGARVEIDAPDGSSLIVNTRHDFKGHSQWNPTHGPSKAAQLGFRDDVYVCGHLHYFGYQCFPNPAGDRMHHSFRVGAYKRFDSFAKQIGAIENNASPCVGILVNPQHEGDPYRYIQPAFCLEQLEDMVTAARLM